MLQRKQKSHYFEKIIGTENLIINLGHETPGSNFFGKTPLFFRYSGVNAANAVNLQAKRR